MSIAGSSSIRRLKDVAVVIGLHELASVGGRATGRQDVRGVTVAPMPAGRRLASHADIPDCQRCDGSPGLVGRIWRQPRSAMKSSTSGRSLSMTATSCRRTSPASIWLRAGSDPFSSPRRSGPSGLRRRRTRWPSGGCGSRRRIRCGHACSSASWRMPCGRRCCSGSTVPRRWSEDFGPSKSRKAQALRSRVRTLG